MSTMNRPPERPLNWGLAFAPETDEEREERRRERERAFENQIAFYDMGMQYHQSSVNIKRINENLQTLTDRIAALKYQRDTEYSQREAHKQLTHAYMYSVGGVKYGDDNWQPKKPMTATEVALRWSEAGKRLWQHDKNVKDIMDDYLARVSKIVMREAMKKFHDNMERLQIFGSSATFVPSDPVPHAAWHMFGLTEIMTTTPKITEYKSWADKIIDPPVVSPYMRQIMACPQPGETWAGYNPKPGGITFIDDFPKWRKKVTSVYPLMFKTPFHYGECPAKPSWYENMPRVKLHGSYTDRLNDFIPNRKERPDMTDDRKTVELFYYADKKKIADASDAVGSFNWGSTAEGYDFWFKARNALQSIATKALTPYEKDLAIKRDAERLARENLERAERERVERAERARREQVERERIAALKAETQGFTVRVIVDDEIGWLDKSAIPSMAPFVRVRPNQSNKLFRTVKEARDTILTVLDEASDCYSIPVFKANTEIKLFRIDMGGDAHEVK